MSKNHRKEQKDENNVDVNVKWKKIEGKKTVNQKTGPFHRRKQNTIAFYCSWRWW